MAMDIIDCPHCRQRRRMDSAASTCLGRHGGYFLFVCPSCSLPLVIHSSTERPPFEFKEHYQVNCAELSFKQCGWKIAEIWPKLQFRRAGSAPEAPGSTGAIFEHCQELASKGAYELAINGLNLALKKAQKFHSPGDYSKPRAWLTSLVKRGDLTKDMGYWANHLRGLGSACENATAEDAEEFSTFVYVVLEQLFGTRSKRAEFRKRAQAQAGATGS